MIDRSDLTAAVNAGVLSSEQAMRLEAFLANRRKGVPDDAGAGESENLRFLSNFNDIFITIGLIILFGGFSALFGYMVGSTVGQSGSPLLVGGAMSLGIGVLAWAMMEYFCLRRRMLLPSMFLALVTSIAGAAFVATLYGSFSGAGQQVFEDFDIVSGASILLSWFVGGFLTAGAIFKRFGLPFSLFLMAFCAAAVVYVFLLQSGDTPDILSGMAILITGLITLAVAIMFDMRDPERVTRISDHAFWLHLAAAPQVIYGIRGVVTGSVISESSGSEAITILIVLILLAILSLALNRRALIAASMLTFIYTLSIVFQANEVDGLTTFIVVSMIVGGGVVFIGAGWKTARNIVLKFLPTGGIWGRLFPPEIA